LEVLERREHLSVSPSLFTGGTEFIRYNDGELFQHDAAGFHRIDVNVASVSAGLTHRGMSFPPVAFIVYNNGQLFEWTQDTGFSFIDINVVGVVGSGSLTDTAWILYNNGQLFRHSLLSGFSFIAGSVTSMSPTLPGTGDLFYVQTNHMLSEHLSGSGSVVIDGNVQSVSASQVERDSAFVLYTNSALFEFQGGPHSFTPVDTNVASVSAGTTVLPGATTIIPAAFYVTRDGVVVEWRPPTTDNPDGTYNFLDANVASISASQANQDDVFIVYNNDMLFEHTGFSRRSGFTFIDSNVSP
jgi:hypothetical protein